MSLHASFSPAYMLSCGIVDYRVRRISKFWVVEGQLYCNGQFNHFELKHLFTSLFRNIAKTWVTSTSSSPRRRQIWRRPTSSSWWTSTKPSSWASLSWTPSISNMFECVDGPAETILSILPLISLYSSAILFFSNNRTIFYYISDKYCFLFSRLCNIYNDKYREPTI